MPNLIITDIPWQDGNDHLWDHFTCVNLPDGRSVIALDQTQTTPAGGDYRSVSHDLDWSDEDEFSLDQWHSMFPDLSFVDLGAGGIHVKNDNFCPLLTKLDPLLVYAHTHAGLMWFDPKGGFIDNGDETFGILLSPFSTGLVRLTDENTEEVVWSSDSILKFVNVLRKDHGFPDSILDAVLRFIVLRGGAS